MLTPKRPEVAPKTKFRSTYRAAVDDGKSARLAPIEASVARRLIGRVAGRGFTRLRFGLVTVVNAGLVRARAGLRHDRHLGPADGMLIGVRGVGGNEADRLDSGPRRVDNYELRASP